MSHPKIMLGLAFLIGFIAAAAMREPQPAEAFVGTPVTVVNPHYNPPLKCERWVKAAKE